MLRVTKIEKLAQPISVDFTTHSVILAERVDRRCILLGELFSSSAWGTVAKASSNSSR